MAVGGAGLGSGVRPQLLAAPLPGQVGNGQARAAEPPLRALEHQPPGGASLSARRARPGVPFPHPPPPPSLALRERGRQARVAPGRAVLAGVLCPCCSRTAYFGQTEGPPDPAGCVWQRPALGAKAVVANVQSSSSLALSRAFGDIRVE